MKVKAAILTVALGSTLVLAACGGADSSSKDDKKDDTKSAMTNKKDNMMKANEKVPLMAALSGEGAHKVSGTATIDGDDLKLMNFKTDEGPDLHVYLTKDGDIKTGKEISKIDLKAAEQNFSLTGVETADYNTAVIYCEKAHEVFGQAPLNS
ncbi:putative lipoprotein [Listeria weihenstephanensis FSL R9-0317]|uniref:DM13 domain-containing protein n=1 Tax=Listeria weihenstephanensis TaxID=1006155 RepID=A0A1S7FSV3_9LIST|nr:DM13 domain-containing protein [Listeria weihenstephanensis]AQY50538.1 hypothetical protein UE46_05510 [Listeria weihenstephanensis]EUJ41562.1 putative lipoprotein [Listeria weihenstephanensis FSL R9-0317]